MKPEFEYTFYTYLAEDRKHRLVARLSLAQLNDRYQRLRRDGGGTRRYRIDVELEIRETEDERIWTNESEGT